MLRRQSRPVSPPSMATMEADVDLRCIGEAAQQLHGQWSALHDDDIALLALRGTVLRQKLHEVHHLDDRGRCLARACRGWWPWSRRSACVTHRLLVDCGRAGVMTLWTSLFNPTGSRFDDERVHEWLRACTLHPSPATPPPAQKLAGDSAAATEPLHVLPLTDGAEGPRHARRGPGSAH